MTNQVIPEAAVEAAAKAIFEHYSSDWDILPERTKRQYLRDARLKLEAAAPILLSHEREETRLAHLDAVVNAATVSKYEVAVDAISALMADPEHCDSQGPSDGYVSVENLRAALAHILTVP